LVRATATSSPPKLTPLIVNRSDDINVAQEAWLWLKVNLAYLTGAVAVLVIGVILARLLSKWADLALTSNTRIEPTVAKFLSNIIRYAL
jgi:small conductance mechanosensitive channel